MHAFATPSVQRQPLLTMTMTSSQARPSQGVVDDHCADEDTTMSALLLPGVPVDRTFTVVPDWTTPGSVLATPSMYCSGESTFGDVLGKDVLHVVEAH